MNTPLGKDNILIDIDITVKEEAIKCISLLSKELGICDDANIVFNALLKRENEFSTNVGEGIAIPHIKCKNIKKATLIVIKAKNEFYWDDGEKVKLIISILTSEKFDSKYHLKILSNLSRKLINSDFKRLLTRSQDKESIFELINCVLKY